MLPISIWQNSYLLPLITTLTVVLATGCDANKLHVDASEAAPRTLWKLPVSESEGFVPGSVTGLTASDGYLLAAISLPNQVGAILALSSQDGTQCGVVSPLEKWHSGAGPRAIDDRAFIVGLRGPRISEVTVFGLSVKSRKVLWEHPMDLPFAYQNPLLADTDHVYVRGLATTSAANSADGVLVALSTETGKMEWRKGGLASPATVLDPATRQLYIGTGEGKLIVLDSQSGRELRQHRVGRSPSIALLRSGNQLVWFDLTGVQVIDRATWKTMWRKSESFAANGPFWPYSRFLSPMTEYPARLVGNRLYYMTIAASKIRAAEVGSGKLIWSLEVPKNVDPSVFEVVGDYVVFATHNDADQVQDQVLTLHWIDKSTGLTTAMDAIEQAHIPGRTHALVNNGHLILPTRTAIHALAYP